MATTPFTQQTRKHRLTQRQKDANDYKWYKEMADLLDQHSFTNSTFMGFYGNTEYKRKKVNYDLFNNIINLRDFEYVCQPFGAEVGELPATMTNKDIVSRKIKVLLGMEMQMPFSWRVIAVNDEATTRKEQEETTRLRDFVVQEVMAPINAQIQKETLAQTKGRNLTPEEEQQVMQEAEDKRQSQTPDEVRKYMVREHQDPAEALGRQLLQWLILEKRAKEKFQKGWKHLNLSGEEIYHVGIFNGHPDFKPVNSLYFDYDKSPDLDNIQDGEWAVQELRLTPTQVIAELGDDLTDEEIDRIYQFENNPGKLYETDFTFDEGKIGEPYTVRVLHCAWKALRKIGFLHYYDRNREPQMKIVDENYRLNIEQGDIKIEWEWIPEAHETYKILSDIYTKMRPVPGQHKDLDNLWKCNIPYYGAACDNLNSPITSPMDRMKTYQYYYNIIMYRIELLMASDKGKILAANINAIPKSSGIDIHKFQYFMEANKIAWFNPQEEGNKGQAHSDGSITNLVKDIDMSLVGDISKYIEIAEYIERKCGETIGVTPQMEGAIQEREAVSNTRQNIAQSSHIIRPYFELHNTIKGDVLTALLEAAKVAYGGPGKQPMTLSYVLDDMTLQMLRVDPMMLDSSVFGLYIANSSRAHDAKQAVEGLAQAAMQNQTADLADIIKVIKSDSVNEAEELLDAAALRKSQQASAIEREKLKSQERMVQMQEASKEAEHRREIDKIITKEKERRKTEIQKQAMLSIGFNENKDTDEDAQLDVLEVAQVGVDANIKVRKQTLDENKFEHQKEVDKQKLENDKEKIKIARDKPVTSGK